MRTNKRWASFLIKFFALLFVAACGAGTFAQISSKSDFDCAEIKEADAASNANPEYVYFKNANHYYDSGAFDSVYIYEYDSTGSAEGWPGRLMSRPVNSSGRNVTEDIWYAEKSRNPNGNFYTNVIFNNGNGDNQFQTDDLTFDGDVFEINKNSKSGNKVYGTWSKLTTLQKGSTFCLFPEAYGFMTDSAGAVSKAALEVFDFRKDVTPTGGGVSYTLVSAIHDTSDKNNPYYEIIIPRDCTFYRVLAVYGRVAAGTDINATADADVSRWQWQTVPVKPESANSTLGNNAFAITGNGNYFEGSQFTTKVNTYFFCGKSTGQEEVYAHVWKSSYSHLTTTFPGQKMKVVGQRKTDGYMYYFYSIQVLNYFDKIIFNIGSDAKKTNDLSCSDYNYKCFYVAGFDNWTGSTGAWGDIAAANIYDSNAKTYLGDYGITYYDDFSKDITSRYTDFFFTDSTTPNTYQPGHYNASGQNLYFNADSVSFGCPGVYESKRKYRSELYIDFDLKNTNSAVRFGMFGSYTLFQPKKYDSESSWPIDETDGEGFYIDGNDNVYQVDRSASHKSGGQVLVGTLSVTKPHSTRDTYTHFNVRISGNKVTINCASGIGQKATYAESLEMTFSTPMSEYVGFFTSGDWQALYVDNFQIKVPTSWNHTTHIDSIVDAVQIVGDNKTFCNPYLLYNGIELISGTDYDRTSAFNDGKQTYTFTFKNSFYGTLTYVPNSKRDISDCTVNLSSTTFEYNGEEQKPTASGSSNKGESLSQLNVNCSSDSTNVGSKEATISSSYLDGTVEKVYTISKTSTAPTVVLTSTQITFDNTSHQPTVSSVTLFGTNQTNYSVKYYRNDVETTDFTNAGTIVVKVTCDNSSSIGTASFTIDALDISACNISFEDPSLPTKDFQYSSDTSRHRDFHVKTSGNVDITSLFKYSYYLGTTKLGDNVNPVNVGLYNIVISSNSNNVTGSFNYKDSKGSYYLSIDGDVLNFIDNYMYMSSDTPGQCLSCYPQAKQAMTTSESPYLISEFSSNMDDKILLARTRYEAWARFFGDKKPFEADDTYKTNSEYRSKMLSSDETNTTLIIVVTASSLLVLSSLCIALLAYKKKAKKD